MPKPKAEQLQVKDLWIGSLSASWDSETGVVWIGRPELSPKEIKAIAAWVERNNLK